MTFEDEMKITCSAILIITIISLNYSCLEPSGIEGSAAGQRSVTDQEIDPEIDESVSSADADGEGEEQTEDTLPSFALIEAATTASCATSSCHSEAGGIPPTLETAEQWRALTDDLTDGDERTNGEAAADTIDPNSGATPMPPAGNTPLRNEDIQAILEWVDLGMP